jgi:hypothetical protein
MDYKKGTRVKHPNVPDWGPGEVLEDSAGDSARLYFAGIKPTITKNAADICGFDLHYRPALNWATYSAVLRFSELLKNSLVDLKPRDMIDVQSFMWCIRPDKAIKAARGKEVHCSDLDQHS